MQPSMELRWFVQGVLRDDLNRWFETSTLVAHAAGEFKPSIDERHDTYLRLPHRTDLGIKLRKDERIEIKERLRDNGIQALSPEVEGRIEQWVKWSFLLNPEEANLPDTSPLEDGWIDVQKTRRSRKLAVHSANLVVEIEPKSKAKGVPEGCNLELTTLSARNQIWHTLGFEAFGSMRTVERNLALVVSEVLLHSRFPPMKARDSFGYPEWLRRILLTETSSVDVQDVD